VAPVSAGRVAARGFGLGFERWLATALERFGVAAASRPATKQPCQPVMQTRKAGLIAGRRVSQTSSIGSTVEPPRI
jgi:hypothetical protein